MAKQFWLNAEEILDPSLYIACMAHTKTMLPEDLSYQWEGIFSELNELRQMRSESFPPGCFEKLIWEGPIIITH